MSCLTLLCYIVWRSGVVSQDFQTGMVIAIFKKADWRMCFNYARVLERTICLLEQPQIQDNNAVFILVVEPWASSLSSQGCYSVNICGSLFNQSTCALWTWRRHLTTSLGVCCGGRCRSMGCLACCYQPFHVHVQPQRKLDPLLPAIC